LVDPRLAGHARATRPFLVAAVALGLLSAVLIIAQAWLLAQVVTRAFAGADLRVLSATLGVLLCVVVARAAVAWATEVAAVRSATLAKAQLRRALLTHLAALGPSRSGTERSGAVATLATRGLDALDSYFSLYLPQVVLAMIVPVAVVAVVLSRDWISAAIIVVTLPLIPVFMALVGATTRERTETQLRTLQRLAGHFLDVVRGLPTLKVFGRAKAQIAVISDISARQRQATMDTLRVTFLSSLILELLATVSVALVAVAVGLRLLNGDIGLRSALLVLLLAPEAYLPLRQLGANYHASAEGRSAADQVFAELQTPAPRSGEIDRIPDPANRQLSVDHLTVMFEGRRRPALPPLSLEVSPGERMAITGPSGAGKSTLLNVLLGFVAPTGGAVRIGGVDLAALDLQRWREHISWVPQRPHLFAASIADNIRLGRAQATDAEVWQAVRAAGLEEMVAARPDGLRAVLGEDGRGISAGERQRVALARAFLRDAPLLLLDEPTASLDGATEQEVLAALARLMQGRTAILVAHRPALVALADRVVSLAPPPTEVERLVHVAQPSVGVSA
jgi:thiol reductant ABC exporter CydD subunit